MRSHASKSVRTRWSRRSPEREEISAELKDAGFLYVALDLAGYKPGSLNAALGKPKGKPGKKPLRKKPLPVISVACPTS